MSAASRELYQICCDARRRGLDFPTIWRAILEPHPLVRGVPVQVMDEDEPMLEVLLHSGHMLRFGRSGFVLA